VGAPRALGARAPPKKGGKILTSLVPLRATSSESVPALLYKF